MKTVRRVLYATDLSAASQPAWEHARQLGTLFGAEVLVLHVLPVAPVPTTVYFPWTLVEQLREAGQRQALERLDALISGSTDPGVKTSVRVEPGSPAARGILEVVREEGADLIVMGTHGHTGLGRVLLGSVADRVVRLAPCPVVTVPAEAAGLPGSARITRVCYASDFSPSARAAWPWALALAEAAGAELDLVHVTALPVPDADLPADAVGQMARLLHEQGQAEAERFLQTCSLPRDRVHVVIGRGVVSDQILHWARARSADLIVMGTHGWSGLLRWTLGSVAHHVTQAARRPPVLTVGPRSLRSEERDELSATSSYGRPVSSSPWRLAADPGPGRLC
jgi:nucleotide-binding universal stress UspA family protein